MSDIGEEDDWVPVARSGASPIGTVVVPAGIWTLEDLTELAKALEVEGLPMGVVESVDQRRVVDAALPIVMHLAPGAKEIAAALAVAPAWDAIKGIFERLLSRRRDEGKSEITITLEVGGDRLTAAATGGAAEALGEIAQKLIEQSSRRAT